MTHPHVVRDVFKLLKNTPICLFWVWPLQMDGLEMDHSDISWVLFLDVADDDCTTQVDSPAICFFLAVLTIIALEKPQCSQFIKMV